MSPPLPKRLNYLQKMCLRGRELKKITLYVFIANFKFWSNNCDISPRITAVGEVSKSHKIQTGPFPMAIPMDIPIYIQSFVTPSCQPTYTQISIWMLVRYPQVIKITLHDLGAKMTTNNLRNEKYM